VKKLVSDEDFDARILEGLLLRKPGLDLVRVTESELRGVKDPDLLAWSAEQDRILLSHDRKSMVPDAKARIAAGETMAGLILVSQTCPIGQAIDEILLVLECYPDEQWANYIESIPL